MNYGVREHFEKRFEDIYTLFMKAAKTGCSTDTKLKTV